MYVTSSRSQADTAAAVTQLTSPTDVEQLTSRLTLTADVDGLTFQTTDADRLIPTADVAATGAAADASQLTSPVRRSNTTVNQR